MKFENKKWVLRVALAGALSLGVASVAKADARLDGMGADVRQVDDVDAIWLYPNEILQYKNTVDFRLNPSGYTSALTTAAVIGTNEWGGVIHDLGDDFGTIATYVNRASSISNVNGSLLVTALPGAVKPLFGSEASVVGSATNIYAPTSNVDVFWAHTNFLGLGDAGIHLNYGDNENTATTYAGGGANVESQVWGLSFGLNLGPVIGFSTSQLHVDYSEDFLTLTRPNGPVPLTDNGVYTIKLGWLGQAAMNDKDNIRLYADLQYDNDSLPNNWSTIATGVANGAQAANDTEFLIGSSIKHNISDRGFVNTGLEFEYDGGNSITNNAYDSWTLLWDGSVESSLSSWLTMRAGLDKAIVNRTYTSTSSTTSTYTDNSLVGTANTNVAFSMGLSANVENWTLDTTCSVAQFDKNLGAPAVGAGIMYTPGTVSLISVAEADLRYKF